MLRQDDFCRSQSNACDTHDRSISVTPAVEANSFARGSLRLMGGIIELGGAGVLCTIPEPTMISKVGCVGAYMPPTSWLLALTNW